METFSNIFAFIVTWSWVLALTIIAMIHIYFYYYDYFCDHIKAYFISMKTTKILKEVLKERKRQNDKWGEQNHVPPMWLTILAEEHGEVAKAILEHDEGYRTELIHVAAVAVAAIEAYDRSVKGNKDAE